jgi:flavin-dependent dehydrogenase
LRRWRTDAFLIGNAAGEAHPIIGEGISMAIQSAWLLCEQLVRSRDALGRGADAKKCQREIHQRYAAQWRAHFLPRMRLAALFAQAAMRPTITRSVLHLLRRAPGLLTYSARWSGKIRRVSNPAAFTLLAPTLVQPVHRVVKTHLGA